MQCLPFKKYHHIVNYLISRSSFIFWYCLSSGCPNKIPFSVGLNNRSLFLTVLELGVQNHGTDQLCLWKGPPSWPADGHPLTVCSLGLALMYTCGERDRGKGREKTFWCLFFEGHEPPHEDPTLMTSSNPDHLL